MLPLIDIVIIANIKTNNIYKIAVLSLIDAVIYNSLLIVKTRIENGESIETKNSAGK